MAVKRVLRLPDPILKMPCLDVAAINPTVEEMITDLVDTMRASPACVGLAAPQIGIPYRAFVVDVTGHKKAAQCHGTIVLMNPEIIEASDSLVAREGCMSVPDLTGDVGRPSSITVRGLTPEGEERTLETDAFEARAILHEIDHLDGTLFLDRVQSHAAVFPRKVYR
jgi:peptide deformylase